jgi:hypothetical protein
MTRFIVLKTYGRENVLGYIDDRQPKVVGILAASVIKGAIINALDGWTFLPTKVDGTLDDSKYRPAIQADFDEFRVSAPVTIAGK